MNACIQAAMDEAKSQQALLDSMDIFMNGIADVNALGIGYSQKHTFKEIEVNGVKLKFMIDSGTPRTIIDEPSYTIIRPHCKGLLNPTQTKLYAYQSKEPINFIGEFRSIIKYDKKQTTSNILVSSGKCGNVLDGDAAAQLGITPRQWEHCNSLLPNKTYQIGLANQFPNTFSGRVGLLKNFQATITVDSNIRSVIQAFRPVPYHQRQAVEDELDRMLAANIIELAKGGTQWQLPMVVVIKKDGSIRICTDGRPLKKAIIRARTAPVTVNDIKHKLAGSKLFSKLDLKNGYFQIELDEESRKYTTFATHRGNYQYKRLNMGLSCSAEIFQREIARILTGIDGQINISDDILIYAKDEIEHDKIVDKVLQRLEENGITINVEKCIFKVTTLTFFGMVFSQDGISPDPKKVESIMNAKPPDNPAELQSFLGLTNFVSSHIADYGNLKAPLYNLLKKETKFEWGKLQQHSFESLKEQLSTQATAYYDQTWKTTVICDASGVGIGAVLVQECPVTGKRVIVETVSRVLSEIEQRYSTIEKESLAIVWACEKLRMYLEANEFRIVTDCRAAELIYKNPNSKPPIRIQRWAMRLSPFEYEIEHQPGKTNIADYLSRKPTGPAETDTNLEHHVNAIIKLQIPKTISTSELVAATNEDKTLQKLKSEIINNGDYIDNDLASFRGLKDCLWITGSGLEIANKQIVIPTKLQDRVIDLGHEAHQGITKTIALLREKVYFQGLKQKVTHACSRCQLCIVAKERQNRNPVLMHDMPEGPFEQVALDFYGPMKEDGGHVMVCTDLYTRWPEVEFIKSVSASNVLPALDKIFARFGYPTKIRSDNGAPFNGKEWVEWVNHRDIIHAPITPYHSQANGVVERFMQNITKQRRIATAAKEHYKTCVLNMIKAYRSTPHATTGTAPALLLLRCPGNLTRVPTYRSYENKTDRMREAEAMDKRGRIKMQEAHDNKKGTNEVILQENDAVYVRIKENQSKEQPKMTTEVFIVYDVNGREISAVSASGQVVVRDSSQFEKIKMRVPITKHIPRLRQRQNNQDIKKSTSNKKPKTPSSERAISSSSSSDIIDITTPPPTPIDNQTNLLAKLQQQEAIAAAKRFREQRQYENKKRAQEAEENIQNDRDVIRRQILKQSENGTINMEIIQTEATKHHLTDLLRLQQIQAKQAPTANNNNTETLLSTIIYNFRQEEAAAACPQASEQIKAAFDLRLATILQAARTAVQIQNDADKASRTLVDNINEQIRKTRLNTATKARMSSETEEKRQQAAALAEIANNNNRSPADTTEITPEKEKEKITANKETRTSTTSSKTTKPAQGPIKNFYGLRKKNLEYEFATDTKRNRAKTDTDSSGEKIKGKRGRPPSK